MKPHPPGPISMRGAMLLGWGALAILVLGFGLWSALTQLSGAIVASGHIEVERNRQIVQHPDGGIIETIHVSEGTLVERGEVLISLDGRLMAAELAIIEGRLFEMIAQRARLEAERDEQPTITFPQTLIQTAATRPAVAEQMEGQSSLFTARRQGATKEIEQLKNRVEQIHAQITGIDAQSQALDIQLQLIRKELASQQALLDKGLAQATSVLALQREEARLMGHKGALISARAEASEKITEINVQIGRITLLRRTDAADLLPSIASDERELTEQRAALQERISRLEIRAPVSGVVLGLAFTTPRAVVRGAEPVLYLVPQDRPLLISAQVAPIHIDEISLGQTAELVFSAFSSRATPNLKGKVTGISADTFSDHPNQPAYYRIEVTPDLGEIEKLGAVTLVPGMPVEAFVQTQNQSAISYFLKPFTAYFSRAFRES